MIQGECLSPQLCSFNPEKKSEGEFMCVCVFAEELCEGYWKGAVVSKEKLSLTFMAEHL